MRNVAGNTNMWVDVLCIPQEDSDPEKAIEIGKQSHIFKSASRAAVWLCSGGDEAFIDICSSVPEEVHMIPPDALALNKPENIAEARRRLALVAEFPLLVPWTTSLWTLQEAALRPDAVFYGKLGIPLRHRETGNPLTIRHLTRTLSQIHDILYFLFLPGRGLPQGILDKPEAWDMCEGDVSLVFQALDAVNVISLHKLANMNASELLLASNHRKSTRQHDRVYGIMGAIGGVTVPVDYKADADKVMDAFMVELHNRVPAEMQAFYRSGNASVNGRKWAVDEDAATVPGLIRTKWDQWGVFLFQTFVYF
ncbi:heterokaryon incompatibility protein [Hirsutella rhossiliensis]|uniref:Heterokaryon incompatibility protein (HET) domain-containing protein n=1 Tax=Hirsutella rhossiliensis TaxID=111463 RepID=A0A9P8SE58_9HYPO|nr:heterokaryon incompatibility protein (HET) domain-containing protein [Hirsutella rhossiliensis]KAH0959493.1 heterokaryon incompatibility protein (HET) domain-containing protein [Hirsutella rhossiliensis]